VKRQRLKSNGTGTERRVLTAIGTLFLAGAASGQPHDEPLEAAQTPSVSVLRSARDTFVRASDFAAAREPAEQIVTTLEDSGETPEIDDLLRLARIQAELKEFDAAEATYLGAIDRLVTENGEYSPTLIPPYQALGRAYINARRFDEAVAALEQARTISRRDAGLFNVEQSSIIDDISLAKVGAGDTAGAYDLQLQRLENAVRLYGADDPRVAPFHVHLGDYLDSSRLRTGAREEYTKALELQEAELGPDSPALLPGVRRLVEIDLELNHGPEARDRLAALLERNPDADALERALGLATLGDWAIAHEDTAGAAAFYSQAYAGLANEQRVDRDTLFGKPKMLDFVPPLSPVDRGARSRAYFWATIKLAFDVSADGRAWNVDVLEINPPETLENDYVRRVRETHFRPKLVGGVPAPSDHVELTHYFRLYAAKGD